MKLTTERTELNLIQKKDFKELIASFREENAVKYIKHLQNLSNSEYTDFLENKRILSENQHLYYWVVREKETQKYIGTMGVMPYLGSDSAFHIGFRISKDFQGKGFATELGKTVIDFVKNKLKHQQIFGLIMEGNIASQTLLKKLEFHFLKTDFNTDYQIQLETYRLIF
ncbi:GNAT family N-acetyltransferase [Bernardetia sp. Wsw4-3y2]|uniref:GNAT family N-acetyltransferase n=1 Tax=Bernardetia sp. Wsw4-3y2 TaxID=3127471 RepID=UPI0030CB249C